MDSPSTELPKPPIPYITGWKFTVQSHESPAPTPVTSRCCYNSEPERVERKELSPLERCLKNHPLAGQESNQPPHRFDLKIVHPVRIGDGHNSQVFIVKSLGEHPLPEDKTLVAKLYDPLYIDDNDEIINPFKAVDHFYTHEMRAYDLLSKMQGHLVPQYYGSYKMDIAADSSRVRAIRLILIEYIMKTIIDFESTVYHRKNILLRDMSPRNVMLLETTALEPSRHVIFVDFAVALFNRKLDHPLPINTDFFLGQYMPPLLRWSMTKAWKFLDWIDWDREPWVENEYAHTAGTITQEMRDRFSFCKDKSSGDLRNVIKTVVDLPTTYTRSLGIAINDIEFDIVARNIMILILALVVGNESAIDCIIHLWYSASMHDSDLDILSNRIRPLIQGVCSKIQTQAANKSRQLLQALRLLRFSRDVRNHQLKRLTRHIFLPSVQVLLPSRPSSLGLTLLLLSMKVASTTPVDKDDAVCSSLYQKTLELSSGMERLGFFRLELLQSAILISVYETGHGIYPAAFTSVGRAARLGQVMGLHDRKNASQIFESPNGGSWDP
ncbi:uncharacterized protein KD926_007348 [Aspergillus affinis]|uniref:uncharacterized protein n=1 Tax=Aspergillus affinis TaxID=1070780 RepID=UPI0022FE04D5|nr:uncharacterized protein KD926_007348 [Aspergillus affinis]KAI9041078.1 hypothetical protein KD926_007348 [Aspergillus affinis]